MANSKDGKPSVPTEFLRSMGSPTQKFRSQKKQIPSDRYTLAGTGMGTTAGLTVCVDSNNIMDDSMKAQQIRF